jgi:hypothetical protein
MLNHPTATSPGLYLFHYLYLTDPSKLLPALLEKCAMCCHLLQLWNLHHQNHLLKQLYQSSGLLPVTALDSELVQDLGMPTPANSARTEQSIKK